MSILHSTASFPQVGLSQPMPYLGKGIQRAAGTVKNAVGGAVSNTVGAVGIKVRKAAHQAKESAINAVSREVADTVGLSNAKNAIMRLKEAHRAQIIPGTDDELNVYVPSLRERIAGFRDELILGAVKCGFSIGYVAGGVSAGLEAVNVTSTPEASSYEEMSRTLFNGVNSTIATIATTAGTLTSLAANWVVIPVYENAINPAWHHFVSPAIGSAARLAMENPVNTAFATTITGLGVSAAMDIKRALEPAKIKVKALNGGKKPIVSHKGPESLTQRFKDGGKGLVKLALASVLTLLALKYNSVDESGSNGQCPASFTSLTNSTI